jgi:endonuclease G
MELDRETLSRARLAVQEAVRRWIYDPNVMCVDFGWRESGGELVKDELTIRIHIIEKYQRGPMLETAVLMVRPAAPSQIISRVSNRSTGETTGYINISSWGGDPSQRARRIDQCKRDQHFGCISNSYATLGCLVKDRRSDKEMILSNWHVLAAGWSSQPGLSIYQPGRGDGGTMTDTVAKFSRHAMASGLDAAVAELTGSRKLINDQLELGPVKGVSRPEIGMEVVKSGRRTGITHGIVTNVLRGTFKMSYGGVERLLYSVVTIEPRPPFKEVSAGGDSGSLWCQESTMHAIALHFAGSDEPERALGVDLQPVLDGLNVEYGNLKPMDRSLQPQLLNMGRVRRAQQSQDAGYGLQA